VPNALATAGYRAHPLAIYRAVPVPLPADVCSVLAGGRVDAVLFLSGSTVRAALEAAPGLASAGGVVFGALGPLAAEQASALGIHCHVIPERPRVADLVADLQSLLLG
jgi:uroporphyrinogen-III synthase